MLIESTACKLLTLSVVITWYEVLGVIVGKGVIVSVGKGDIVGARVNVAVLVIIFVGVDVNVGAGVIVGFSICPDAHAARRNENKIIKKIAVIVCFIILLPPCFDFFLKLLLSVNPICLETCAKSLSSAIKIILINSNVHNNPNLLTSSYSKSSLCFRFLVKDYLHNLKFFPPPHQTNSILDPQTSVPIP